MSELLIKQEFLVFPDLRSVKVSQPATYRSFMRRAQVHAVTRSLAGTLLWMLPMIMGIRMPHKEELFFGGLLLAGASWGLILSRSYAGEIRRLYGETTHEQPIRILNVRQDQLKNACEFETDRGIISTSLEAFEVWREAGEPKNANRMTETVVRQARSEQA